MWGPGPYGRWAGIPGLGAKKPADGVPGESLFWWGGFGNSLSSPFSTGLHQSKERREKERGDEGRTGWAPSAPWQGNTHKCQKERRSLDHDFCSPSTHTGNATQTHLQHVHRRPPSFAAPILYPGLKKKMMETIRMEDSEHLSLYDELRVRWKVKQMHVF